MIALTVCLLILTIRQYAASDEDDLPIQVLDWLAIIAASVALALQLC